jgi:hypothetical protein
MKAFKFVLLTFLTFNIAQAIELRTYDGYMELAEIWRSEGRNADLLATDLQGTWVRELNEYTYAGCQNPNNNALLAYRGDNQVLKIEMSRHSPTRTMVTKANVEYITSISSRSRMIEFKTRSATKRMVGIIDHRGQDKLIITSTRSTNIDGFEYDFLGRNKCPNFSVYSRF